MIGTWEFDRAATEAYLKPAGGAGSEAAGGLKKFLEGVSGAVGGVVASAMAGQLEGVKMEVTATEIRHRAKDGTTKAVSYQIVERPDANTLVLQTGSGEKMTFRREGATVWRVVDDKDRARLFLKRG
jgi:hypothetical protein